MADSSNPTPSIGTPSNFWGDLINKMPFAEHLDKLPTPVKSFIDQRPGTAVGIAALAALGLMSIRRR